MRTKLGDFLRELRSMKGERLKDMANYLDVSSAFLSAVENGKKKMPYTWVDLFKHKYDLSESKVEELKYLSLKNQENISIDISNISDQSKELAISFARRFASLDENTTAKMMKLLSREEEEH